MTIYTTDTTHTFVRRASENVKRCRDIMTMLDTEALQQNQRDALARAAEIHLDIANSALDGANEILERITENAGAK